jgi:voltage-gated potassium channel
MNKKIRRHVFEILEVSKAGNLPSKIFDIFIITLISLNILAVIMETVESLMFRWGKFFEIFEIISVVIFTVEYLLRLWSCTSDRQYSKRIRGRIRFAFTPLAIIDLIAILPFYLPMLIGVDLRFVRALRLFRIFRVFKFGRYSQSLRSMANVLRAKKEELIITGFTIFIMLIVVSSLMYYFEHEAQPEAFSSIPAAMWWGVASLTTVGYGDIYPVTAVGKFLAGVIAVLGIGLFALPAGIIASGFIEEFQKKRGKQTICPHCGKVIDDPQEGIGEDGARQNTPPAPD